ESNQSLLKNPNPQIEHLHIQAYNLDLGIGVPQDRVAANKLYLQTALAGDPRSMFNLSINLWEGQGIAQDKIESAAWLELARFHTQRSKDMKMKWTIRNLHDDTKRTL